MAREFNRNLFIMLFSIMIGIIIITYFVADIINRSKMDTMSTKYTGEIASIKEKNENFTSSFLKSSVVLDQAREDRALGNYHYDLASLWYYSGLTADNSETLEIYKTRGIDNCTNAMPIYLNSHLNFEGAKIHFNDTKSCTDYVKYLNILDIYVNLTESGSNLTMLRYNASLLLMYLTENLTFDETGSNVTFLGNVSDLQTLFNQTMDDYNNESQNYDKNDKAVDEYDFFEEIR